MATTLNRRFGSGRRRSDSSAAGKLNLVSLMDIFTILVFFLLVNSNDAQEVPSSKIIEMPESVAEEKPRETVVVMVTADRILVQGREVAKVDEASAVDGNIIPTLREALAEEHERLIADASIAVDEDGEPPTHEVTIMGDKGTPFRLLKKVMATCTDADYTRVSLAVVQRAGGAGDDLAAGGAQS
ncbi:MAG: biopolymer transporter ExbD [Pseudomonadota bacterium]